MTPKRGVHCELAKDLQNISTQADKTLIEIYIGHEAVQGPTGGEQLMNCLCSMRASSLLLERTDYRFQRCKKLLIGNNIISINFQSPKNNSS